MKNEYKGFLYALLGTALLSTNFVTAKYGLKGFNVPTFSFIWTSIACVYALIFTIVSGNGKYLFLPRMQLIHAVWLGATTGVAMILTWAGLSRLDPLFASFLWRFAPVFTVILGVIYLSEKMEYREVLCLVIMIAGGLISAIGRWHVVGAGMFFTLLACLISSIPMVIAKKRAHDVPTVVLIFYRTFISMIILGLWLLVLGRGNFQAAPSYWLVILLGTLIGPVLSFFFLFKSYSYWDLSHSTIVTTLQPLFVFPLAYLFFNKPPVNREVLGGTVILVGAFWFIWLHFKKK